MTSQYLTAMLYAVVQKKEVRSFLSFCSVSILLTKILTAEIEKETWTWVCPVLLLLEIWTIDRSWHIELGEKTTEDIVILGLRREFCEVVFPLGPYTWKRKELTSTGHQPHKASMKTRTWFPPSSCEICSPEQWSSGSNPKYATHQQ